jgi:hypothetical protein
MCSNIGSGVYGFYEAAEEIGSWGTSEIVKEGAAWGNFVFAEGLVADSTKF